MRFQNKTRAKAKVGTCKKFQIYLMKCIAIMLAQNISINLKIKKVDTIKAVQIL